MMHRLRLEVLLSAAVLFLSVLPAAASAALPSAGLVSDWDPALITGLTDGDAVSTLPEAVSGKTATSSGANRPLYKTSVAPYPVVLFDGVDDYVQSPTTAAVQQPITVFMVFKPLRLKVGDRFLDGKWGGNTVVAVYPYDINLAGIDYGTRQYSLYSGAWSPANPGGSLTENGGKFGMLRAKFHGTTSEISINRNTPVVGNAGTGGFNGYTFGGVTDRPTMFPANYYLARVLVYDANLASATSVEDYLTTTYNLAVPNMLVTDGDSLTRGTGSGPGVFSRLFPDSYPDQLLKLLGSQWAMVNTAVSGQTAAQMEADASTEVDSQLNTLASKKVLIAWAGTNDLYFGATAAASYSNYTTYLAHRKAAGWKVIAATILPRSSGNTPASFEADRQKINTDLRANWSTYADGLVDLAADTRIGAAGSELTTAYYDADRVHLNAAGYAIVAAAMKAKIDTLLASATPEPAIATTPATPPSTTAPSTTTGSTIADPAQGTASLDALLSQLSRAFSAYITQLVTQLLQGSGGSSSSLIAIPALETTLPDTASLTVDWRTSAQQMATLTGPRTITFVNITPGQLLRLVLCQDQTGSRTVTWPASVTWSGSAAPALSTGSGRCDVVSFIGTNAKGTIKALGTLAPNF